MVQLSMDVGEKPEVNQVFLKYFNWKKQDLSTEKIPLDGPVICPWCHSANVQFKKQGYSLLQGFIGLLLIGPLGLLVGFWHSNRIHFKCFGCGYRWHD